MAEDSKRVNLLDKPDIWTNDLRPQPAAQTLTVPRELISKVWDVINEFQHRVPSEWAQEHPDLATKADKLLDDIWYVLGGRKGFFGSIEQKGRNHGERHPRRTS
jgi:hypothetical protein